MPTKSQEQQSLVVHQAPQSARSPRYENSLQTHRSIALTNAADQLLNSPAPATRRVMWMGPGAVQVVDVDAHDPILDVQARIISRNRRAKMMRELTSFLDHVKGVLGDTIAQPSPAASGGRRSSSASPAQQEQSPSQSQSQQQPATGREQEEVNSQTIKARVDAGELLISAYDGSTHDEAELLAYNAFVHDRMLSIVRDEIKRVERGDELSMVSGTDGRHSRRPDTLPALDQWNRLPPWDDANGNQLDREVVLAARRQYNADAMALSRAHLGFRCFRPYNFAAEFERQKTLSPVNQGTTTTDNNAGSESPAAENPAGAEENGHSGSDNLSDSQKRRDKHPPTTRPRGSSKSVSPKKEGNPADSQQQQEQQQQSQPQQQQAEPAAAESPAPAPAAA